MKLGYLSLLAPVLLVACEGTTLNPRSLMPRMEYRVCSQTTNRMFLDLLNTCNDNNQQEACRSGVEAFESHPEIPCLAKYPDSDQTFTLDLEIVNRAINHPDSFLIACSMDIALAYDVVFQSCAQYFSDECSRAGELFISNFRGLPPCQMPYLDGTIRVDIPHIERLMTEQMGI